MISKRIAGRKDGRTSASAALRYGEGLTPDRTNGDLLDKSHRTRFGGFGLIDDGVYAGRSRDEMSELVELAAVEKNHIHKILHYTHGNKTEAARLLNIGLTTLYRKIDEYHLN